eukprot:762762-Alexandrium_andersonii.AAC.1
MRAGWAARAPIGQSSGRALRDGVSKAIGLIGCRDIGSGPRPLARARMKLLGARARSERRRARPWAGPQARRRPGPGASRAEPWSPPPVSYTHLRAHETSAHL